MATIYGEATPPGRGGVSVLRISGPEAFPAARSLAGDLPPPRHAALRTLRDDGEALDAALVLCFPAGGSFTGEDTVELHLHGAPVIVARVAAALRIRGVRLAEPGEFTRRAFANGRLDLTEVEGLADLLAAETEGQRRLAASVAHGGLRQRAAGWRAQLVEAGALLAAALDFADEGDVPARLDPGVLSRLSGVRRDLAALLEGSGAAERLRRGFTVAIVGPPNAGKSTLLNRLASREVALVTEHPGTTRDVIEFRAEIDGLAVTFLDTAGVREAQDRIEAMGVALTRQRAEEADLRVHLSDEGAALNDLFREGDLVLPGRADLTGARGGISGMTGTGVDALVRRIGEVLRERVEGASVLSHERQRAAVAAAHAALEGVETAEAEIQAEMVREALAALARLVGSVDVEDYLEVVFSRFCIGK